MASSVGLRDFVPLSDASSRVNSFVNLVGVVTDFLEPVPSRGTDLVSTFTIKDDSWDNGVMGLKIRFFRKEESDLPTVTSTGDVVILLYIKISTFKGETIGTSNHNTKWVVFPKANIERVFAKPNSTLEYEQLPSDLGSRSQAELAHVKNLYRKIVLGDDGVLEEQQIRPSVEPSVIPRAPLRNDSTLGNSHNTVTENPRVTNIQNTPASNRSLPPKREKFSLIQGLNPTDQDGRVFADLCCEVRKKYDENDRVNLSVTDYTSNELLFNYAHGHEEEEGGEYRDGDEFGYTGKDISKWRGPWGRMTLTVTCFDKNAQFVRSNINVGDYVYLSNVHMTMGHNRALLEGKLRGDRGYPDKIHVQKMAREEKVERLQSLLQRKLDYKKRYKQLYKKIDAEGKQTEKRPREDEDNKKPQAVKKTKTQLRKEKKREQQIKLQQETLSKQPRTKMNENISCQQIEGVTSIALSDILDNPSLSFETATGKTIALPFQNVCYKTKIRVIDFFPPSLEDFAAPHQQSDRDFLPTDPSNQDGGSDSDSEVDLPSNVEDMDSDSQETAGVRWEWRFTLLVEDPFYTPSSSAKDSPKPQTLLHVDPMAGDYLFNATACNLKRNPEILNRIREKLYHLWGDLEEDKRQQARANRNNGAAMTKATGGMSFECYIREYGIPKPGNGRRETVDYERMFQLWGVNINA